MKKGWEYRKLENCLVKVPKQKELKTKDYKTFGQYPIVSQESTLISGYSDDIDKVFSHVKPIIIFGDHTKNVKYIDFDFVVGADGVKILMPQDDIISKFFYYVIKSFRLDNLGYARHYRLLKENIVPVPPLSEQQRIVSYLDSAFAKIDAVAKNAEASLNEAKALFQSALTKMMEPKEGWEEKKLGDITCKITDGSHNPPKGVKHSGFMMLSSKNIRNDRFTFDNPRYLSKTDFEKENLRTDIEKGDVLLTIVGAGLGQCCVYPKEFKVVFQRSAAVIKPRRSEIDNRFLMYSLQNEYENIREKSNGAAQKGIYLSQLAKYVLSLPSLSTQQSIVSTLDSLKSKVDQLQSNLTHTLSECAALKQSILRETFE